MSEHVFSVKSNNLVVGTLKLIEQSYNTLVDEYKDNKNYSVNISIYLKDIGFMLNLTQQLLKDIKTRDDRISDLTRKPV